MRPSPAFGQQSSICSQIMALASKQISLDYLREIAMTAVCAYAWFQEEQYLDLFYVLGNRNPHEQLLTVWGCSAEKDGEVTVCAHACR